MVVMSPSIPEESWEHCKQSNLNLFSCLFSFSFFVFLNGNASGTLCNKQVRYYMKSALKIKMRAHEVITDHKLLYCSFLKKLHCPWFMCVPHSKEIKASLFLFDQTIIQVTTTKEVVVSYRLPSLDRKSLP